MSERTGNSDRSHVWIRLIAEPESVPFARQFARDAVTEWQYPDLVDDAALCVTELASNAALHSESQFIEVSLVEGRNSVRIFVDDHGHEPAADLVRMSSNAAVDVANAVDTAELASTGRGLFLVSAVASEWGIEETATGKRIWVRLAHNGDYTSTRPETTELPNSAMARPLLPAGWHTVRLVGCPVDLALAHSQRLDDLVRELQLVNSGGTEQSRALGEVIEDLLRGQVHARQLGRHILQDAAAQGMERVDIELPLAPGALQRLRRLYHALAQADVLCAQERLLTLASSQEMVGLRAWVEQELLRQIKDQLPPVRYDDWISAQATD